MTSATWTKRPALQAQELHILDSMTYIHKPFANIRFLALAAAYAMFTSAPAGAVYWSSCMDLLAKDRHPVLSRFVDENQERIAAELKSTRLLSPLEYEAYMDFTHDLPLFVHYKGGEKSRFFTDSGSKRRFAQHLRTRRADEAVYLSLAQTKLNRLYKHACEALGRSGCETYSLYSGLNVKTPHPFTAAEEQVLKWSAFHLEPTPEEARAMRSRKAGPEVTETSAIQAAQRGHTLLVAVFSANEADLLAREVLTPHFAEVYDRAYHPRTRRPARPAI